MVPTNTIKLAWVASKKNDSVIMCVWKYCFKIKIEIAILIKNIFYSILIVYVAQSHKFTTMLKPTDFHYMGRKKKFHRRNQDKQVWINDDRTSILAHLKTGSYDITEINHIAQSHNIQHPIERLTDTRFSVMWEKCTE